MPTCALLTESCVVLSSCPVQGTALLAVLLISGHQLPPTNCVDVILTIPVDVIVPLSIAVQFVTAVF